LKNIIYTLCFCSLVFLGQSQSKADSLKKLGRQKLIELAVKKLNDPSFDPAAYDRVIVKASKTSVIVEFGMSLVLLDKNDCFYDKVMVTLVGGGGGWSIQGDCKEPKYYKLSSRDQKKIDFIFESINKDNEIGNIPDKKIPDGSTMKVTEKLTHYYVEMNNFSTFSHYNIEKVTGNIYDANHKHYARDWDEKEEEYQIIK
jgi:hypothetical protein